MDNRIEVKFLSQQDLIEANCFNIPEIINEIEKVLYNYGNGNIIFPNKVATIFEEKSQSRINCLPAGLKDDKIYGMKWVSVFPENPYKYNRPNLSAVILLSETTTGFPIAFMDGTLCSNLRTAGVSAVAAKYLAPKESKTIGFIGAGEQAKSHFMTIKSVLPSLKTCKVSSRTSKTEQLFIKQMSELYADVEFLSCNGSYEKAAENSDVIVTAISGQKKILKYEWIKRGALYCHVAGLEDDYNVALNADKIICDDWETVKHRTQTISRMYQENILKDKDIYADLQEIVKSIKVGRSDEREFIYFNCVGLSYIDISLATFMYKKAISNNKGEIVVLQEKSIFDCDKKYIVL